MRRFQRLFALLFILSIFITAAHQASHDHHAHELCEVCILAHSPALLNESIPLIDIESIYLPYSNPFIALLAQHTFPVRSRSPPIA